MWFCSLLFAVCCHGLNGRTEESSLVAVTSQLSGIVVSSCLCLTVAKGPGQGAGLPAVTYVFQKMIGFGIYTMLCRVAISFLSHLYF